MKRKSCLLVLAVAVLLSAAPVLADDGFYVIAGGGKVGTPINSVPYTISSSGMYYLNGNLTCTSTNESAIFISANDVTLDLMGYCLTGPGKTSGVGNDGINTLANNVEIRNGTVKSFGHYGISGTGGNGIRLIGLRVSDIGEAGVFLIGNDHLLTGCSLFDNISYGGVIGSGILKGNHVYRNSGQGLNAGPGSIISGNVCRYNNSDGIGVGSGCTVVDNTVMNSGGIGITASDGCTVMRNTCRENTGAGIATGLNCLISNNTTQGLTFGSGSNSLNNLVYSAVAPPP
jgi:parallel beta-helix repeat protein